MLTVAEAQSIIASAARPLPMVHCPLAQAAGLVLAADIRLDMDAPPFDRATVDGFAVRAADATAGATLAVIGIQDAGGPSAPPVAPGCCVAVNTGGIVPVGADAVVMVEVTHYINNDKTQVRIDQSPERPVKAGAGIGYRGSDMAAGNVVLRAGQVLGPAQLAVAATAGQALLPVIRRPRVAVLVTGDELINPAESPVAGQIRNSNSTLLSGLVGAAGVQCVDLGVSRDDAAALREKLARGLAAADVTLVSGGMSMGTRDLAPAVWETLGVQCLLHGVSMKPGKPFYFGVHDDNAAAGRGGGPSGMAGGDCESRDLIKRVYVAGLPGNPVSAFVCCVRFVMPLLAQLGGVRRPREALATGICAVDLPANGDREFYQPALAAIGEDGRTQLRPLGWKSSADLFTLAQANALLVHAAHAESQCAGSAASYLALDFLAAPPALGWAHAADLSEAPA